MSIKLLLADDSITIQKVIGIIFGGEEYSLTIVDNGKAAIEKALELRPDVLLIDALMPEMSGYEVCEAVRATPSLASKPVLMLTGSFEPFDEEKAKKCGADDFLAKPFESQQIINKVKELAALGTSRAAYAITPETLTSPEPAALIDTRTEAKIAPAPLPQSEISKPISSSDIWGAFDPEPETPADETVVTASVDPGLKDSFEPDVFSIISDDSDSHAAHSFSASSSQDQNNETEWIPADEHTFEFDDDLIADTPQASLSGPADQPGEPAFDEITFEDETHADQSSVASVPDAAGMTEEQLKAAISSTSKEVIERIVWEVVPDMAEAMIREAIRKIKEGA